MPNFSFSPDAFKKWMSTQKDIKKEHTNNLIGIEVESKLSRKRLLANIKVKDGELSELAADFNESGGSIYDVKDKLFLIEVHSGFFYIPRYFVKMKKN